MRRACDQHICIFDTSALVMPTKVRICTNYMAHCYRKIVCRKIEIVFQDYKNRPLHWPIENWWRAQS